VRALHEERKLISRRARDLASRLFADVVTRNVLFIVLVDCSPPEPCLVSGNIASACTGILDALGLFVGMHSLPCLPSQYASGLPRFSAEAARILRRGPCSEHHLLALLGSEVEGEFDWYFSEADRRNPSAPHKALIEKMRKLSPEHADRLERDLTRPKRERLRERLTKIVTHPEYPFDSIAEAIRAGDAEVATRVSLDARLLEFLMYKHGLQPADVFGLAKT